LRGNVDKTEGLLAMTAQPLTTNEGCGGDGNTQVPNNVYGWGLLDVKAAYDIFGMIHPVAIFPVIVRQE
jgi:hypothetical protein